MFVRGTTPSWYFSQDTSEAIDFCFRVLQVDGLSAPPFDRHPDGDGSLRAAGMTAESWLAWLMEVLQLQREQEQAVKQWAVARREGLEQAVLSFDKRLQQPALAWSGSPAVGQRLQELWEQDQQNARANRGLEKQMRETLHLRRQTEQNLWAALRPYHQRVPPLKVYVIHYAGGVDLVVPPDTVLISDSGLDGTAERTSLLRAAAALADGGEHSWHRPVDALVEEQRAQRVEHLVAEAQQIDQAEDSDPLAAVRKELHRSYLGRSEWRMETLRVAKHKVTPEDGVYYLSVQDQAGKMSTFTCEVVRKPDGLWQAQSCSGGPVALPGALYPLYPLVRTLLQWTLVRHTRPWLWFYGGAGVVYTADGIPKNGFRGSGEMSGRKIVRVRLSDASGELAEDMVESGLVIFRNERQMEAPVEAELYDRAGRLVRRQTIIKRYV